MAKCLLFNNCDYDYGKCPKRSTRDRNCDLTPKPAKEKRIKAWAYIDRFNRIVKALPQDMVGICKGVPCTIVISAKDWKKIKGGK
jgi:hypothetical protein